MDLRFEFPNTLDLSYNDLTSILPVCLSNISKSLSVLNLRSNRFYGSIPELFSRARQLKMIDLSPNQLQGKLPRSLANCKMLEFIDFGNNLVDDTFPSWMASLPELKVLILQSNKFHGVIGRPRPSDMFLKLRILDLSRNSFVGELPMKLFQSLYAMKVAGTLRGNLTYMGRSLQPSSYLNITNYSDYDYSITVIYKGLEMHFSKIPDVSVMIDLSSNLFKGEILEVIGDLKGLQGLNLSNNFLAGHIPSSLGKLTELESLDLSQNKLSGQIPKKLTELGFLSILNVSYNNLSGTIPTGKQFNTFPNTSFEGNSGLCGDVTLRKCGDSMALPQNFSGQGKDFAWRIVLMGYGSGLVIGVVIGNAFFLKESFLVGQKDEKEAKI